MQPNDCFGRKLVVLVIFLLAIVLGTIPAAAESKYAFKFIYNDSSGDYYSGYVYAPDGWFQTGSTISKQPAELGGAAMGGYYSITGVTTGQSSSLDKHEYITSYYDGDTGKTSDTLWYITGFTTYGVHIYIYDRSTTAESGYVYDPSVSPYDADFGSADVCYAFSTSSDSNVDFLAYYINGLRYWDQPTSYDGSCSEVAGAEVLAYWATEGYPNLISTSNWQALWPDGSADSPSSYVSFIGTLANYMNWNSWTILPIFTYSGTSESDIGPGLYNYAQDRGFSSTYGYVTDYKWSDFKSALSNGYPVIVNLEWLDSSNQWNFHSVVAHGYWNDGHYLADFGWVGTKNVKEPWFGATELSYDSAYITSLIGWSPN